MTIGQRNVHNPEGSQKDRCCRLSELLLNMRTKGHELKLENGRALKSASNSFAIALCGINSPGKKDNKQPTQQESGQVALDNAMRDLMSRNPQCAIFRLSMYMDAPKMGLFIIVKNICRSFGVPLF